VSTLVWNLTLALAWCAITGELTFLNLLLGFLIGYFALRRPPGAVETPRYFRKLRQLLEFALFFAKEILLSAARVAYDVVTRTHHMRPAVLAVPLQARTALEIALLANLITLTPGSLSLDLSPDRRTLYVHRMFVDDPDIAVAELKTGFERRVLELLR
jgi:multicomponent Na+:H+ antiporter subunit E